MLVSQHRGFLLLFVKAIHLILGLVKVPNGVMSKCRLVIVIPCVGHRVEVVDPQVLPRHGCATCAISFLLGLTSKGCSVCKCSCSKLLYFFKTSFLFVGPAIDLGHLTECRKCSWLLKTNVELHRFGSAARGLAKDTGKAL